jgi:uncharacterized protein YyaL (SSP411 family)
MANHLANETSPYLLQHANNPVDWYPWVPEALEKARAENKPIFVSIGYAACHWCHVMEHESFEDWDTASLLNRYFVSIKVDREERPDLDMIYMQAVVAMTGQGGWPLNVFLTPEGHPFYGGTYFPPSPRYGMNSFKNILEGVAKLWNEDPRKIEDISSQVFQQMIEETTWKGQRQASIAGSESLGQAANRLISDYDWQNGGWNAAPKFPAPMVIDFLLIQDIRSNGNTREAAIHALKSMQRGGIHDLVGGGFHRYSTDATWLVPHFEKMLYDNAQLALAYLHAYQLTGEISFRMTVESTLDFILRELTGEGGRFFSSLDADSEGEEGKFYTWTLDELKSVLDDPDEFEFLRQIYQLPPGGNFENRIILQSKEDIDALSEKMGLTIEEMYRRTGALLQKLLEYRIAHRARPATDDKTLVAWNALAIQAFAESGRVLQRIDYLDAARRNADFLLNNLYFEDHLFRSWRAGVARQSGTLEDYSSLVISLLTLYQSDFDLRWYAAALKLAQEMVALFLDPAGGFYMTPRTTSDLPLRPKDLQDNATPSGNAQAVFALLLLSAFTGNGSWREIAEETLIKLQVVIFRYPSAFPYWLKAFDFAIGPAHQVALVYPDEKDAFHLLPAIYRQFMPRTILAGSGSSVMEGAPDLLKDRPLIDKELTAYFCHGFVCDLPVIGQDRILSNLANLK